MDLQLPGIDGYAALELIRGHGPTAHIPVVALTAFAMRRDRERALDVRVRRLPREADQRPRVPGAGAPSPSATGRRARHDGRCRRRRVAAAHGRAGARRRRPRDEPQAHARRARAARLRRALGGVGGGGARRARRVRRRRRAARRADARARRLRHVCPDQGRPAHRDAARRHGDGERGRSSGCGRSRWAPTTSSPSPSTRPSCGAGALAGPGQAAPRHHRRADRRARALERRARGAGGGAGRRPRAAGPAAPLPLAPDRRAHRRDRRRVVPREPPSRHHDGLHRPARLHRLRRDGRAGGDDGGAARLPRRARRAGVRATRARSSTSPATGSWSSSTTRRRAPTRPSARCGWPSTCATASTCWPTAWRRQGHDLGFGVGIAQGYATLGRVGFEGRWDYAAIGTVTNVAARLCAAAAARQILDQPAGARRPRRALRDALARADSSCAGSRGPWRSTRSSAPIDPERRPMNPSVDPRTRPTRRRRPRPRRPRRGGAGPALRRLQQRCPRCGGSAAGRPRSRSSSCRR